MHLFNCKLFGYETRPTNIYIYIYIYIYSGQYFEEIFCIIWRTKCYIENLFNLPNQLDLSKANMMKLRFRPQFSLD